MGVDVDGAFRDARRELDAVRTGGSPAGDMRGEGEAADGQVRVVAAGGKLERIELDPRVKRMSPERLAEHLVTAGNSALAAMRAKAPAQQDAGVDPAVLAERLEQVANEGLRSMAVITQAIEDAMARVAERTGMSGDPSPRELERLLEQTRRSVPAATREPEDDEAPDPVGEGRAADGRVWAQVTPDGRIAALRLDPAVMRSPSEEVAVQTCVAVNAALDDMRARSRDHAGAVATVDPQRLQELREDGVRQMGAYAGALRDLIASIYRR